MKERSIELEISALAQPQKIIVCRAAKHLHLPIILTGDYSRVLAENGSYGFGLLHKPYSVDQLARVLHKAIAWHGQVEPVTG